MEINREASDKIKGITLQKLRALKLAFETIENNPIAQVHIAIEHGGDVFLFSGNRSLIEENKNYDSKNFSFSSGQILNTIVYFLDYWLRPNVAKSTNVFFSFYSTNNISKENQSSRVKKLGLKLPKKSCLELLSQKEFDTLNLIEFCSGLLLDEYQKQYKGQNFNYDTLSKWTNNDWVAFLKQVNWIFGMPDHLSIVSELQDEIIKYSKKKNINVTGKYDLVRAALREKLEDKQYEGDITQRFLTDIELENVFYKVANNQIQASTYQYLDEDYSTLKEKQKEFVQVFVKAKYNSLMPGNGTPYFQKRKVKKHSGELKLRAQQLSQTSLNKVVQMDILTGEIPTLLSDIKPNFLFGEIGSGKSSLIGHYAIAEIEKDELCIFIPVNYLKGLITIVYTDFLNAIDSFINNNVLTEPECFELKVLLLSKESATLVVDGLDELAGIEAKLLIGHLEKLNREATNLKIIATGRPLELQSLVNFNDWNCLTTLDLSEAESLELLTSEAVANGLSQEAGLNDAKNRMTFLANRKQLFNIAKTPLIICLLRDYLTEQLEEETLGSLMYKILNKRLAWDSLDTKASYQEFFNAYPSAYLRENPLAAIAYAIGTSEKQTIRDIQLFEILEKQVPQIQNRNKVITEAASFYKTVFLQQADQNFSFTSQPLFEIAYGVALAGKILEKEFQYDINSHNWQPLSFAVAINRVKGQIEDCRVFLKDAIDKMLHNEKNTPHAATLVSESKDSHLAKYYIQKLSQLPFRPIYVWLEEGTFNTIDSFSPFVIADAIYLAGEEGFNWFYQEYLNPKDPTHHSDETLIANVLKNFFAAKSFLLNQSESKLISGIIPYHAAAKTGHCGEIFSLFVLVIPEAFDIDKRCRLLVSGLRNRLLHKRALELLQKEFDVGNQTDVLNALEIECKREHGDRAPSAMFWLKLNTGLLNDVVLRVAIKAAAKGDHDIFDLLLHRFGVKNFKAFLIFKALCMHDDADYAAILLYERFQVDDFYLVCRPILIKTEWSQFHDTGRRSILDNLMSKDIKRTLSFFLKYIPFKKNKKEIPELYLYYFVKLLTITDDIYKDVFLDVVRLLPEHAVLSRYPELREAFAKLMECHPQYRESLKLTSTQLDAKLRFNANSLLLACFPEDSITELENLIRSVNKRLMDGKEWIRFCMKLNYSQSVLKSIVDLLPQLPPVSRYYALILLYHQDYLLSADHKSEMIEGILGDAMYFDMDSAFQGTDGLKSVSQSESFLPELIAAFDSDDQKKVVESSSLLSYYHMDRLTKLQRFKVHLLESEKYSRNLFAFHEHHKNYFQDSEVLEALSEHAEKFKVKNNVYPRLYLYYLALSGDQKAWIELFHSFVFTERHGEPYELEFTYRWLKTLVKEYPQLQKVIGIAAREMTSYPAVTERKDYNTSLFQLAIIANEFGEMELEELKTLLQSYGSQDGLICSLLFRCEDLKLKFIGDRSNPDYINFFAQNNSQLIKRYKPEDIQKLLVDSSDFPSEFTLGLLSEILYGENNLTEVKKAFPKSKSTALFYAILDFCKDEKVDFNSILHASDQIGWPFYPQASNGQLREALYLIKEVQSASESTDYMQVLIERIKNPSDEYLNESHEYFKELFNLDSHFPIELLNILFKNIIDHSYNLNYDLFYKIVDYISSYVTDTEFGILSKWSENYIKGLVNQQNEKGEYGEQTLTLWMFGLISLYVDGEPRPHSTIAYLMGLVKIFSFGNNNSLLDGNKQPISFSAREMLLHSLPLYEKINPQVLQAVIENGIENGTLEIKAVCRVLTAFTGIR